MREVLARVVYREPEVGDADWNRAVSRSPVSVLQLECRKSRFCRGGEKDLGFPEYIVAEVNDPSW